MLGRLTIKALEKIFECRDVPIASKLRILQAMAALRSRPEN